MICEICSKSFLPYSARNKYCSKTCSVKANNQKQKDYKQRWYLKNHGREELFIRTSQERWIHKKSGYVLIKVNYELVYEHRILAQKALGKPLPKGAIVHHTRGPADNHEPFDLVICPSQEYHMLLHKRMEELGHGQNN